jgi:sugar transferase (PEP-CTERM system associated)
MILSAEDVNHTLTGYVECSECRASGGVVPEEQIIGEVTQLLEIVTRESATMLIVTNPQHFANTTFQNLLLNCKLLGVDILDVPSYFESVSGKLLLEDMDMNSLIYSTGFKCSTLVVAVKRLVDVIISIIGIILMLPFFPIIMLLVKLNAPGPLFYRQVRVGHMGRHFCLYKFRTMPIDAETTTGAVWAQENDPRIRPIGRFLRKSRLDELPQLFNVLVGNMSFVGPRPERPEFVNKLEELIPFYGKRHFLKPGITGWAQIKHPYGASTEESYEKLRYDLYYFKNMNPVLDSIIFLKTIKVVLSQIGGR